MPVQLLQIITVFCCHYGEKMNFFQKLKQNLIFRNESTYYHALEAM
jgi:hypothetical protein